MTIENITAHLRSTIQAPLHKEGMVDVAHTIYTLLHKDEWDAADLQFIEQAEKKIDINKKLLAFYSPTWKNTGAEILPDPWQSIFSLLSYRTFLFQKQDHPGSKTLLKKANVLLKSLQLSGTDWLHAGNPLYQLIFDDLILFVRTQSKQDPITEYTEPGHWAAEKIFRTIPITVLFYEGPIARAYLECIYSMGLKPQKIIRLVPNFDVATGKAIAPFLPAFIRQPYAGFVQKKRIHFWPRYIGRINPELKNIVKQRINESLNFSETIQENALALKPIEQYSDNIVKLSIDNLADKKLAEYLASYPETAVLYTGGGLMPKSLLALDQIKFIHVHPGFLPQIRGADCLLWSTLLTGHPSASCFYMTPGIDLGNIIFSIWLPAIQLSFDTKKYDVKTLYRSIYAFVDPWVRCYALRILLSKYEKYTDLATTTQTPNQGVNYHFMHPELQRIVVEN